MSVSAEKLDEKRRKRVLKPSSDHFDFFHVEEIFIGLISD